MIRYLKTIPALIEALHQDGPPVQGIDFHLFRLEEAVDRPESREMLFRTCAFGIVLLLEGEAYYEVGLRDYHLHGGTLFFLGPRNLISLRKIRPLKGFMLLFMNDFIQSRNAVDPTVEYPFFQMGADVVLPLKEEEAGPYRNALETMLDLYRSVHPLKPAMIYHHLHLLLLQAGYLHRLRHPEVALSDEPARPARLVRAFEGLIEQHFYEAAVRRNSQLLSIGEIADQLNVSTNYLGDVVKRETGVHPSHFIQHRTVMEAKSLLKNTDLSVAEVGYRLGFSDHAYFARFFRKVAGLSPSSFRRKP
ncbi:helix-turn-helix domain-containing protein [Larkinella soli]|uniref:helix-turn-helix domain-containing protein n=1 Tax=Larkinella soli TaxID=1770527 RepID=UPI000FFBEAA4|nr:helix-turn-helix transcriptional regulator [Larkinella soli]